MGGSAPRILALDDYFMVETEKEDKDAETGRKVITKVIIDTFVCLAIPSLQLRLTTALFSNLDSALKSNTQHISIDQCRVLVLICSRSCLARIPPALCSAYDVGFNPSTQRHYRRLIYYLYIHSYMVRSPEDGRTTETCSDVYISNILTYDSDVA
jgi:hypothetical protein